MQRTFLTILLTGALAAACAQPEPPPPGVAKPESAPAAGGGYITTTMGKDPNPPGTGGYVISPGEPNRSPSSGRPRIGGDPTF